MKETLRIVLIFFCLGVGLKGWSARKEITRPVATFSIVARDSNTGELGVAVASRFFAVGTVVPWAKAGVGAIATQAYCNTGYGPEGLALLAKGLKPDKVLAELQKGDKEPEQRQVGIVSAGGESVNFTGKSCNRWAGGRKGTNYAIQGNILTGEAVVVAMEKAFLETKGTLAKRMLAALLAGDNEGGDSRGRQSAALIVVKDQAGYGGFNDRKIDIRVDDLPNPLPELGRLLDLAEMTADWNDGWTLFTKKKYAAALELMEKTVEKGANIPEVMYDLAVIRLAGGKKTEALQALAKAIALNSKLKAQAAVDNDLKGLKGNPEFEKLIKNQ